MLGENKILNNFILIFGLEIIANLFWGLLGKSSLLLVDDN